ncbi:MAG TPA: hypothetical protein PLI09_12510 [Candidatus Hydrogenedentes bacterium]|nr:hypothetical protein [Candidatus Hydrogenedentota bacterium]
MRSLTCTDLDRLSEVLFELAGVEIEWESIPNATTGIRCKMPGGEIINYFPTTFVVTVQGKGDPLNLRARIEDALYDACKLEPPVPAILPPPTLRGVPNAVVIAFGSLSEDAERLAGEFRSYGLRPILWDVHEKGRNSHADMAHFLRPETQFGVLLIAENEWKDKAVQCHLGLLQGMVSPSSMAMLLRKTRKTRLRDIPHSVTAISFEDRVEEIMNDVLGLVYTNADRSVQKLMFRANKGRQNWNIPRAA